MLRSARDILQTDLHEWMKQLALRAGKPGTPSPVVPRVDSDGFASDTGDARTRGDDAVMPSENAPVSTRRQAASR